MPRSLEGAFADEPLWTDLRFARAEKDVSLRQPAFRNAVGDLAAPIHGRDKDVLIGDDITQHRRTVRIARAAVAILAALVIALTPTSSLASPSARMGARSPPPAWTALCGFGMCARTPLSASPRAAVKVPSPMLRSGRVRAPALFDCTLPASCTHGRAPRQPTFRNASRDHAILPWDRTPTGEGMTKDYGRSSSNLGPNHLNMTRFIVGERAAAPMAHP